MTPARLLLLFLAASLAACSFGPVATKNGVWMGGSAGTKSKGYYASYDGPHGSIKVGNAELDETAIPRAYITGTNIKAGLSATTSMFRSAESTKRVLSGHQVEKVGIKSAAEIEKAKLAIPEEIPAVAPGTATFDPTTGATTIQ